MPVNNEDNYFTNMNASVMSLHNIVQDSSSSHCILRRDFGVITLQNAAKLLQIAERLLQPRPIHQRPQTTLPALCSDAPDAK